MHISPVALFQEISRNKVKILESVFWDEIINGVSLTMKISFVKPFQFLSIKINKVNYISFLYVILKKD